MSRKRSLVAAMVLAGSVALGAFASSASAAAPVDQGHFRFDSGPYASNLCGVDGTEDDVVVGSFVSFASGFNINRPTRSARSRRRRAGRRSSFGWPGM